MAEDPGAGVRTVPALDVAARPAGGGAPAPDPLPRGSQEQGPGSPRTPWRPWSAPVALIVGIVAAALAGLAVDIPALLLGVKLTSSHTPPGVVLADTFVQDAAFVAAAVWTAHLTGRAVYAWQLGLRSPSTGFWRSGVLVLALIGAFLVVSVLWSEALRPEKEKLLETLGSNEGAALLILSAALTCVIAPVCEEILFRGYVFTALRNWRGTGLAAVLTGILFGAVHAGSAPALDLVPLGALGAGLCLLYRRTGSLYPCMAAHSINNSLAFGSLEEWAWWPQLLLLVAALLAIAALARAGNALGVTGRATLVRGTAA
jgi:membrane protease YdiL (CAAX protease family)